MGLFHIFADESGKLAKSDYTAMCGYIAQEVEWARFGMLWNTCRVKWGVPPIHMARIMNPDHKNDAWKKIRDQWGEDWKQKRDAMLRQFGDIVSGAGMAGMGAVLDTRKFRELQAASMLPGTKDPNVFTFQRIIMRGIDRVKMVTPQATITLIIDDDPENAWGYYSLLQNLKVHPDPSFIEVKDRIDAICFGDDREFPGLQAADMLAWTSREFMVSKLEEREPRYASGLFERLTQRGINQPTLYTAEMLESVANGAAQKAKDFNNGEEVW